MKNYLLKLAVALFCTMMSPMLTSCVSEDNSVPTPVPDPSQLADVTNRYNGLISLIDLYVALGGGTK